MKKLLIFGLIAVGQMMSASAQLLPEPVSAQPKTEIDTPLPFSVSDLFSKYQSRILQIRVINEATGQKTSIGSGFIVGDGSLLATNYHVVSDAVQKENHRLEYVDNEDHTGPLTLMDVDVIHDLAVVKADHQLGEPFTLDRIPPQGAPLYALGNPHDLGFVIVDGINNGLLKKSAQARILFSGALNGGMSGGPTLNQAGKVVGVNVSYLTSGNNISFIVPAQYLTSLIEKAEKGPSDINASISEQLFSDNENYYRAALSRPWQTEKMSNFIVPLAMSDDVRCWDSSPDADVDDLVGAESVSCFNDRSTFINSDVSIGEFGYSYTHYYTREPLFDARFYRIYSKGYSMRFSRRPQRDYGDFVCEADFVTIAGKPFKTTLCRQPSKHFEKDGETIDDMRLIAAQIGESQEGFMIEIALNGVQTNLGKAVMKHLLEQVQWQKSE